MGARMRRCGRRRTRPTFHGPARGRLACPIDKDSAVGLRVRRDAGVEYLTLYRLVRDDDGVVQRVYSRTAKQEVESRTLYSDSVDDEDSAYSLANDDTVNARGSRRSSSGMAVLTTIGISRSNAVAFR